MSSIKEQVLKSFVETVKIGDLVTKGEIFQIVIKCIPGLYESTVGWIISLWLVGKGRLVEVGKAKHGAKIYKRVS